MFDNIFHFKVDFLETSGRESRGGGSLGICSGGTLSSLIIFCLFVEHCGGTFDNLLSFCGTLSSLIIFYLFVEHCGGTFDNLLSFAEPT